MDFWKLHGTGNDFILIDNREHSSGDLSTLAQSVCHRRFGVGADGLIAAEESKIADIRMVYYNSDGSSATMCGNGLRCFAKFVQDYGIISYNSFTVETGDGIKEVSIQSQHEAESIVKLEMGKPTNLKEMEILESGHSYNLIFMHIGVPHSVIFLNEVTSQKHISNELINLTDNIGPLIEKNPAFLEGTNVNFVQLVDNKSIIVSAWERGAGRTWACGTGACASAFATHYQNKVTSTVEVRMPGGKVIVSISEDDTLYMQGPAKLICKGTFFIDPQ